MWRRPQVCAIIAALAFSATDAARAAPEALAEMAEVPAVQIPGQPRSIGSRTGTPPKFAPAFAGQTLAPRPAKRTAFKVETVASGLEYPWSIKFLPDGRMLVTEKAGRLRVVGADGKIGAPIGGLPSVDPRAVPVKGGLLDVLLAQDFAKSRRIYWSYSEVRADGSTTALATGELSSDYTSVSNVKVIWRLEPAVEGSYEHYGSRLVWDKTGHLFITTGERSPDGGMTHGTASYQKLIDLRMEAQNPANGLGKIIRINPDGSAPEDNPFKQAGKTRSSVWSLGHRNVLGAAVDPATGWLWTVEHGPAGGDELNQPEAGKNYGWPVITYGTEYNHALVGEGITQKEGLEQPVYYWDPNVAPGGMIIYTGEMFPNMKGDLIVGGLASARLSRLILEGRRVVAEEWLPIGHRVRDLTQAHDGSLYLITDEQDGKILRVSPK